MSKFHVSKKEYLKFTSSRSDKPGDEKARNTDENDVMEDLTRERDPKWRKEVMQMLTKEDDTTTRQRAVRSLKSLPEKPVRRIDMLAVPKRVRENVTLYADPFRVRPSALQHTASDRIQSLALPRRFHARTLTSLADAKTEYEQQIGAGGTRRMMPFELSERLKSLAQPKQPTFVKTVELTDENRPMARFLPPGMTTQEMRTYRMARLMELTKIPRHKFTSAKEKRPGAVAYSALVCRASPRVEELAGPVIRRQPKQNDYAFRTRPAALRYNASTRIEQLAMAKTKQSTAIV